MKWLENNLGKNWRIILSCLTVSFIVLLVTGIFYATPRYQYAHASLSERCQIDLKKLHDSDKFCNDINEIVSHRLVDATSSNIQSLSGITPTNTKPTNQSPATSKANASSSSPANPYTYKPYVDPVCTKTPIPHGIKYVYEPYLTPSQSSKVAGVDGYIQTCTASSTGYTPAPFTYPAIDETDYVGTATTSGGSSGGISLQQAQANCSALGTGDSSAWAQCLHAYGY